MAENLSNGMGGLNLNGPGGEKKSYIPPHMRGQMGSAPPAINGGPPPMNGGINGSAWAAPAA